MKNDKIIENIRFTEEDKEKLRADLKSGQDKIMSDLRANKEKVLADYTKLINEVEKEELKMNNSRLGRFGRGAKATFRDTKTQKQYIGLALLGGLVNTTINYAVTRDLGHSVKEGMKGAVRGYTAGATFYAVSNGAASAVNEDYLEYLEEEF